MHTPPIPPDPDASPRRRKGTAPCYRDIDFWFAFVLLSAVAAFIVWVITHDGGGVLPL